MWWAASTVTTVGYGDFVPRSAPGRLIGVVLMFVGIGLVSILTAAIASALLTEEVGDEERHIDEQIEQIHADLNTILAELQRGEAEER